MLTSIQDFKPTKQFLVCVDSDGCAMDTMDMKHIHCFGPMIVKHYGLESIQDEFLTLWNRINLSEKTRGINRFKGLSLAMQMIKNQGYKSFDMDVFDAWVNHTTSLSATSLTKEHARHPHPQYQKALEWSHEVNECIEHLKNSDKPFDHVKETLRMMSHVADIVIVSSATTVTVLDEWKRHGLLQYVSLVACQEVGTKSFVLNELAHKPFKSWQRLMIGDAMGDFEAAKSAEFQFYPILAGHEGSSWLKLKDYAFLEFTLNHYQFLQTELIEDFFQNFNK
jgi:phosphoglycolate phosphatase-like HAD superfamily hydrolase